MALTLIYKEIKELKIGSGLNRDNFKTPSSNADPVTVLVERFKEFAKDKITTSEQNNVSFNIVNGIANLCLTKDNINFDWLVEEDEIVMSSLTPNGINMVVVDSYGDIMLSVSPYKGDGKRYFFDFDKFDLETVLYRFLA